MKPKQFQTNPVKNSSELRKRVLDFFNNPKKSKVSTINTSLFENVSPPPYYDQLSFFGAAKHNDVKETLDLFAQVNITGNIYLFGGILRDLALFGKKGFNSDIDIVVEGNWHIYPDLLNRYSAKKNKFGGYRLSINDQDIDIWNAEETWAITQHLVDYTSINSLLETTILNWDSILMNWSTKSFIYKPDYFKNIHERIMDIVLETNPNPLGMLTRVLRHILLKDAQYITYETISYLSKTTKSYTFNEIHTYERNSYPYCIIDSYTFDIFAQRALELDTFNDDISNIGMTINNRQLSNLLHS